MQPWNWHPAFWREWLGFDVTTRRVPGLVWFRVAVRPLHWHMPARDFMCRELISRRRFGPVVILSMREQQPGQRRKVVDELERRRLSRSA